VGFIKTMEDLRVLSINGSEQKMLKVRQDNGSPKAKFYWDNREIPAERTKAYIDKYMEMHLTELKLLRSELELHKAALLLREHQVKRLLKERTK